MQNDTTELRNQVRTLKKVVCASKERVLHNRGAVLGIIPCFAG